MWTLLLLAATVRSLAHMPFELSDRNSSIAWLDSQNKKFPSNLNITEAKFLIWLCANELCLPIGGSRDFVKKTPTRIIDCDSNRVFLWETWLESSHYFSQRVSSQVRVTKNLHSSQVIDLSQATIVPSRDERTVIFCDPDQVLNF